MGDRTRKIKDFFLRTKDEEQLPREFIAGAIEDLMEQLDDVTVTGVVHGNVGPMGGESSQINLIVDGRWVTINVYGR